MKELLVSACFLCLSAGVGFSIVHAAQREASITGQIWEGRRAQCEIMLAEGRKDEESKFCQNFLEYLMREEQATATKSPRD